MQQAKHLTLINLEPKWQALARDDYHFYCQYTHRGFYRPAEHTAFIAKKLEAVERGEINHIMFFLPPRHSKSMTITETFPSWFLGRNPDKRVIEVSYNGTFAKKFGKKNRDKVAEFGPGVFGEDVVIDPENRSAVGWGIKDKQGGMLASGVGGTITGQGADLLIIDDPIKNREEAYSKTYRDKLWEEYDATLKTRLHAGASQILIMTRWHEDDLAGRILKESSEDWEVINLPALAEENDLLGRAKGDALWPEGGYTREEMLRRKENMQASNWNALYQQRPSPESGNIINKNWWQFYTSTPAVYDFDYMVQSWDCSFKDTADTSYVVGQVWGVKGADAYLLDMVRDRMGFVDTVNAVINMSKKWERTGRKYIEDKANGPAIIETLRHRIGGIIPVNPEGSKIARAYAVTPYIESGNVFLPAPHLRMWVDDYIDECSQFPNGVNDDQVDATTQALYKIFGKYSLKPAKNKPRGF